MMEAASDAHRPGKQPVRMTPTAAALFPDLASRVGTLVRVDGWAVVKWDKLQGHVWLPREMIEEVK